MKRIFNIISIVALAALASSCYEDYVNDYDNSAVYIAYQYDLRTFVLGEGASFDAGVTLAGVISNKYDREVELVFDDKLVNGDLSIYADASEDDEGVTSFTAYEGMMGQASVGTLINSYVTSAFKAMPASFNALSPLPQDCYTVEGLDGLTIKEGRHTATVTIRADEKKLAADAKMKDPYYAIGFRIKSARAGVVPKGKCFEVIAVRYENKYFGNWYHGGVTRTLNTATSQVISTETYATPFPQAEDDIYTLTTTAPYVLQTNMVANGQLSGTLLLTFDGEKLTVSDPEGMRNIKPYGGGSCTNEAKLLQNRKIYLNYQFDNADGTTTVVTDTLSFRNRVRDGVSEWQDENPEHYEN